MSHKKTQPPLNKKSSYPIVKRNSPSPILEVSQANSTSFDTTANTIKPLEIFTYMTIKRKCYAFQLLKQFILFSDDSDEDLLLESYHNDPSPVKSSINLQKAEFHLETLCSVLKRARQKFLLSAFELIKKRYFKQKMVYRNKKYVTKIVQTISNLIRDEHQEIMQYVFLELAQNMKHSKLKQIMQKNRGNVATPEHIEYEDKLFKTREYLPFHNDEQSGIMKNDTESFFESDSRIRIAKDFGIKKLRSQTIQTPPKQPNYEEQLPTTRHKTPSTSKQFSKQLIYIVGTRRQYSFSKEKKPQPDSHIKIPIESSNVDIVRVQGSDEGGKAKRKSGRREEYFSKVSEKYVEDCQKCEYCVKIKLSQQMMEKIKLRRS